MTPRTSRRPDELRPVRLELNPSKHAEGSALIEYGDTKVLCTATVENKVPPFIKYDPTKHHGWVTAEYAMLPRSAQRRIPRLRAFQGGRSEEISRLIARSLRAMVDLKALGECSITVDCDVIQADGGTRTASVTGGFVAMVLAMDRMRKEGGFTELPLRGLLAAVSVGLVGQEARLDLDFQEDSHADADMNVVMTDRGETVEIQVSAETRPFTNSQLQAMLELADGGIRTLCDQVRKVLEPKVELPF